MTRPTIRDIAARSGVSTGAVSFALNGRPGVSDSTRKRIVGVAQEMGWTPNAAARALSDARARAIGLVIARPIETMSSETFFLRLIAGIEQGLRASSYALVLQIVDTVEEEVAVYRRWWSERRVDGVLVVDPREDDLRPAVLAQLDIPAVVVGGSATGYPGSNIRSVCIDDAAAMRLVVDHLVACGHRTIAYVTGLGELAHTRRRHEAVRVATDLAGVELITETTDFTEGAGAAHTLRLLAGENAPTALVFDNEVLALGGLSAVRELGLSVPQDVAIVSWEDSSVCRVVTPAVTALVRDPVTLGSAGAELLLKLLLGTPETQVASVEVAVPGLVVRGSTVAGAVAPLPATP